MLLLFFILLIFQRAPWLNFYVLEFWGVIYLMLDFQILEFHVAHQGFSRVIGTLFDLMKRFLAVCFSFFLLSWGKIDYFFVFSFFFTICGHSKGFGGVYISLVQIMRVCVCANEFVARFTNEKKKENKRKNCVVVVVLVKNCSF